MSYASGLMSSRRWTLLSIHNVKQSCGLVSAHYKECRCQLRRCDVGLLQSRIQVTQQSVTGNECFLILTLTPQHGAKAERTAAAFLLSICTALRKLNTASSRWPAFACSFFQFSRGCCSGSCACLKGETCENNENSCRCRTHTNNIYPQLPDVAVTRVSMR